MSKSLEYEKIKQSADKIYDELMGLPSEATKEQIIAKYDQWISTFDRMFYFYLCESIDDLYDLAKEGIELIKKLKEVRKHKYRSKLKEQKYPVMSVYKDIRERFRDFRNNCSYDLPPLPKRWYKELRIYER